MESGVDDAALSVVDPGFFRDAEVAVKEGDAGIGKAVGIFHAVSVGIIVCKAVHDLLKFVEGAGNGETGFFKPRIPVDDGTAVGVVAVDAGDSELFAIDGSHLPCSLAQVVHGCRNGGGVLPEEFGIPAAADAFLHPGAEVVVAHGADHVRNVTGSEAEGNNLGAFVFFDVVELEGAVKIVLPILDHFAVGVDLSGQLLEEAIGVVFGFGAGFTGGIGRAGGGGRRGGAAGWLRRGGAAASAAGQGCGEHGSAEQENSQLFHGNTPFHIFSRGYPGFGSQPFRDPM